MTQQHSNFFSSAINEAVNEMIEVLSEYFREDLVTGFLEEHVPADELRAAFEQAAQQTDLAAFQQAHAQFEQTYGRGAWEQETTKALRRQAKASQG